MSETNGNTPSEFLNVRRSAIESFMLAYRKEYFEDHSTEWGLDEIIARGMAEIKRQVKTAVKTAENKAAGNLLRLANLTPKQAAELLLKLKQEQEAAAKASATPAS